MSHACWQRGDRQKSSSKRRREKWWLYTSPAKDLYSAISGLDRVLVTCFTSKYILFQFVSSQMVFSNAVIVIATDQNSLFSVLQSAMHEAWVQTTSSKLETRQRYVHTDCYATYPMPRDTNVVESAGRTFFEYRSELQSRLSLGLTDLLNKFHDSTETNEDIRKMRNLAEANDHAVAAAYGWNDLNLDRDFHETDEGTRFTLSPHARREVIDRLLELNHQRYSEELAQGLHEKNKPKAPRKSKAKAASTAQPGLFDTSAKAQSRTARAPGGDTQAIVNALNQADHPLSKSELLEAAGLRANQWNGAIKSLVDSGRVTQTGEQRGTRYSIPPRRHR